MITYSMAEANKNILSIVNQVNITGEPVTLLKHGQPVAIITPVQSEENKRKVCAAKFFMSEAKIKPSIPLHEVLKEGRKDAL